MDLRTLVFVLLVVYEFVIVASFHSSDFEPMTKEDEIIAKALSEALHLMELDEVKLISEAASGKVSNNFLRLLSGKCKVTTESRNFKSNHPKSSAVVALLEDESSMESFISSMNKQNVAYDGSFLIYFRKNGNLNMERIFEKFWKLYITNINFVHLRNGEVQLTTFFPFRSSNCGGFSPIIINTFNSSWASKRIFPQKLKNLNRCPIILSTFEGAAPAVLIEQNNGTEKYSGYDIELVQGLSSALNFELDVQLLREPAAWGFLTENGTSGGVMKKVMDRQTDIAIGSFYLTLTRSRFMSFAEYSRTDIILVVPPGIQLTSIEKLLSPFNRFTWAALFVTFCLALCFIHFIRQQRKIFRDFVFGTNTGNPYLNMLDVFLNGSQRVEPRRNFSRTLLMIFVLFCLIIRTSYQASLFKFLQTEQTHFGIQTIDELVEKKYDVWMYESFQELSNGLKIHERRKLVGKHPMEFYQQQTLDPRFKGAAVGPLSEALYSNQLNYKNFTLRILPEVIFAVPVAMFFPKNHFLVNEINSKISVLNSAGLIVYWEKKYIDTKLKNVPSVGPQKLNLGHLAGGLYIYMGGCFLGFLRFIYEIFRKQI